MRKAEEGAVLKAPSSLPIRRRQLQPPRLISSKNHFEGTVQGGLLPTDGPTTSKLRPRTWFGLQGSAQGAKAEDTGPTESVWTRHIGSRVRVGGAKTGILLFYGETQFAAGAWCGIRLDEPVGKNDGMVKGVRYFTCEPDHGIFAPPGKVTFEDGTAMEERCGDVTFNRYSFAGPGPELQTAMNVTIDYDSTKLVLGPGGPLSNTMPETGCPSPKKVDLDAEPGPSLQTDLNMTFDCASPSGACEPNATYNPYDIDVWTIGSAATIHHDLRPEIADDLTASGNLANPLGQGDTTFTFSTTVQQSSTAAASHPGQLQSLEASEQFRAVLGPMNATISLNGPNSGPMDLVQSPICESEFRPCGETDLDSTFTVGPMESTPVFARVEGGVQGPPLPLSESCYTIQEPVDEEESVGDEGAVVGRQWSMDLDESFGILTPNQMKDFTVAAEIAPAETPSDEGIQDLAEDEVADEIPNESAPFAVDSVRFIFNETFPNSSLYVTVVSSGRPTVPIPRPTELGDSFVEKPGCPVLNLPTGAPSVDQVSSRSSVAPIPEPAGWDSVISFTERIQQSTDLAPTKEKTVALEATHERDLVYSEVEYPNLAPSNVPPQSTPNYVQGTTVCTEPLQEVGVDVDDCTPVGSEPTDTVTSDLHNSPTPHSFSPGSLVDEVQTRTCVQDFAVPPPQDLEKHRRYCLERFSVHPEVDPTIVQYEPKDPEGQLHCHEVMTVRLTATEAEPVDDRRMDETADSSVVIDSASSGVGTDGLTKVDEGDRGNALESRKSLPDTEPEDVVQTDPLGERLTFPKKATKLLSNLRDLKEEKSKTPAISRVGPIYTEEMIRVLDDSKEGGTANVAAVISGHAGCLDAKFSEPFEGSLADGCGGEVSKAGAKVTDLLDITLGQSPKLPLPERVTIATCHHQLSEKPSYVGDGVPAADAAVEYLIQQMGGNFVQQVVEKREQTTTGMAVSVTSIDTGYQGDAECDLQSDAGTNAANTPVDDGQKEFRVPSVVGDQLGKHLRHGDAGSDSDFCSDMAASWTESDLEGEDRARGRGARIIDGRLYFGAGGGSGVSKDTEVTISSESLAEEGGVKFSPELKTENSAVEPELLSKPCVPEVSTSPPNAEETLQSPQRSVALAAVVPQQYRSSVVSVETVSTIDGSANYGSFVEEDETLLEPKEVSANVPSVPTDVSENITAGLVDGGGKKTLKTSESEQHRTDVSPRPSNKGKPRISDASPKPSSKGKPRTSTPSKKGTSPKTPKSKTPESAKANSDKKEPSSASSKKLKTPKKNVMSKIKAMIEATSNKLVNKDTSSGSLNTSAAKSEDDPKKASRLPKKNRWDAVMSKIAAGQAEEKGKTKKEVASKINSNLAPLKAKSPQAASAPTSGCDAKKKESSGFKTAAPFKVPKARTEVVNAVSSNKTPRSKSGAGAGSDTGDFSVRSRSENSASQPSGPSAQLPISAKTTRPSALPISLPRIGASRSPSVASTASGSSRGSTLSQLTLASLASTRPLQDVSVRSMGSNVSAPTDKSVNRSKLPPISTKKVPLPPATVQASARHSVAPTSASRVVHGTTHRTVTSIEGRQSGRQQQQHHPPPTLHSSRRPLRDSTAKISVDAGPAGRGSVALRSSNDQATHLRSLKNSQGLVKSGPHSDLPHSSVTRSATSREVTRLEALCEARTKELNFVRMQLKHCALGFDSLAILLQHLTQENAAFAVPELCCDLRRGKEKLQTARMELEEARTTQERLQDEIVSLQQRHQQQLERLEAEAQARLQDALETLRKDQEKEHESLMRCHDKEINNLMNKHIEEINILKITQNERINAIDREHSEASEQLQQQHLQEQTDLREIQRVEIEKLMALHEEEKAALGQQIEELNGRCTELEKQCMSLEDVLSHDSDYRIQIATNRCSSLEKEVESLKVVLEMRQSEIQDLRRSTQESRLQSEELATAREEIKKLMAKTEDLQAQMHTKVFSERQLLSDHERLKENFEKEAYMTKRLSMENEELKWRVRQAKEFSITLSPVGGASGDSSDHNGAPPCNMSMYFWDNEGLGASPNGSFSPLKASTAPRIGPSRSCCSPHASPRLSPSKTSHQYSSGSPVSGRPLSAPLSHDHLRHVSTSEDDIPFSGEGQQPVMRVKLRDKPRRPRAVRNSCPAATSKQSPNRLSSTSELDGSPSSEANAVVGIGQHSSDVMMSTPSESPLTRQPTVDHHNLQLVHTVSPCSSELDQRSLSPPVMQAVSGTLHYQNDTGDANDSDEKITDAKVFFGEVETERYAATFEDFSAVSEFSHTTQVISGQYEHFGLNEGCYGKCDVLAEQSQILFWSFPQDVQQPPQSPGDHRVPDQDDSTLMDKNPISIREALKSLLRDSMPNSEKCDVGHAESVESEMTDQVSFLDGATHDTAGLGTMDFESPVFPAIKGSTDEDLKVEDLNSHDELFEVENTVRESVTERSPSKLPLILKQSEINGRDRFVKEAASLEMSVDVTVSSATNQDSVPSGRFSVSVPQHFQCGDSRTEPNLPLNHASISNGSNLGALSDLKVANLDGTVYPIKHRTKSEDASVLSLHQTCVGSVEPDENHLGETIDGILKDLVVFRDLNVGQSTAVSCGATEVVDSEEVIGKSSTADPCSEAAEIKVTSDTVSADALEDETSRTSSEPLDSFSIASSSLGAAPALEPQAWGSIENETAGPVENSLQGESLSPKKTTTLVITFRAHALQSVSSSRGSSPVPPYTVTSGTVSDGSSSSSGSSRSGDDTASSDSSPRASPIGPEQPLPNKALKLLETSLFGGTRSPRTSAGEAMVLDDFSAPAPLPVDPSHQLLKKALQDQLLHDGPPSRSGSSTAYCDSPIESCGHGPSLEDSPLPGLSKPDTPESTSQLVAPTTDSTNCDVSWSDDDLPSETEV